MSTLQTKILVIDTDLILKSNASDEEELLVARLQEYIELNFISVIFVSPDQPDEATTNLAKHGLNCPSILFDPNRLTIRTRDRDDWQVTDLPSKEPANVLRNWISQQGPDSPKVVLHVSSTRTRKLAGNFLSVADGSLSQPEMADLYQQHQANDSIKNLFVAEQRGLASAFAGLHWFDALPPGASENSRKPAARLNAFSIKRDVARIELHAWANSIDVVINRNGWKRTIKMDKTSSRTFEAEINHFQPGDRYAFALNGNHDKLYPDPRSRRQPTGVHGFSELVGPNVYPWSDREWTGVTKEDLIIYEVHLGTFTPEGTFQSAIDRLPELVELGITAIELLPVVESAGKRNWGYDGVNLFAPYHCYGQPEDLKRFVDQCHRDGIAVILDVVYNHPGPEGNYLAEFGPYFSKKHHTPWGPAYNYDGRDRNLCREWVLDNVEYWLEEFHFDGLRFDAIHFMFDTSESPIVAEIADRVRELEQKHERQLLLIGETNIFDANMIIPTDKGGMGLDAIWCDDMMHSIYSVGSPETQLTDRTYQQQKDLAEALRHGYLYEGPPTERKPRPADCDSTRDADASAYISSTVVALQTHDSVGNQPLGKRLHQLTNADFHCAAAPLSLLYPAIPMLFMGDETLEPNPFHYFVDFHDPWLRDAIAKSRRNEHPQQNWEETVSPLSELAFTQSKTSAIRSSNPSNQRLRTNAWYHRLISIRKEWRSAKLLNADQLTVNYQPERHLFQLSYRSSTNQGHVLVRLMAPSDAEAGPLEVRVTGKVVADSLGQTEFESTSLSIQKNHAIVVEGEVSLKV